MLGIPHGSAPNTALPAPFAPSSTPGAIQGSTNSKNTVATAPPTIDASPPCQVARFQVSAANSAGVTATPYIV